MACLIIKFYNIFQDPFRFPVSVGILDLVGILFEKNTNDDISLYFFFNIDFFTRLHLVLHLDNDGLFTNVDTVEELTDIFIMDCGRLLDQSS